MKNHNCKEILSKVFQALDGELRREEELNFLDELNKCNHCLDSFEIEKSFKVFLLNKINKSECSDKLVEDIRLKIQSVNLDEEEQS